jgi:hypothetical protein
MPCSLVNYIDVSEDITSQNQDRLLLTEYLHGLLFDGEVWETTFPRNGGEILAEYTALHLGR